MNEEQRRNLERAFLTSEHIAKIARDVDRILRSVQLDPTFLKNIQAMGAEAARVMGPELAFRRRLAEIALRDVAPVVQAINRQVAMSGAAEQMLRLAQAANRAAALRIAVTEWSLTEADDAELAEAVETDDPGELERRMPPIALYVAAVLGLIMMLYLVAVQENPTDVAAVWPEGVQRVIDALIQDVLLPALGSWLAITWKNRKK